MELVIGGAFQGKLTWALRHYGLTMADVCDLAAGDPVPGKKCYWHLETLTRRCDNAEQYLPLFENAVVITREVGGRHRPHGRRGAGVARGTRHAGAASGP